MQTINWLVQSTADCPALLASDGDGILSAEERTRLAAFANDKRRRDWLLGRWTAKRLLQELIEQGRGVHVPLDALEIETDETGAPYGMVDWGAAPTSTRLPVPLSISHSNGAALCATTFALPRTGNGDGASLPAAGAQAAAGGLPIGAANGLPIGAADGLPIGADIERIELRGPEFVDDYFTPDEIAQIRNAPPAWHDTLVTAIWTAKEAALKVFHVGLTVDARSVSCRIYPPQAPDGGWARVEIRCAPYLPTRTLTGWWRICGEYVLTIAVPNGG